MILAASTVAIVAIAAVIIVALVALIYIVPRGGRRRDKAGARLQADCPTAGNQRGPGVEPNAERYRDSRPSARGYANRALSSRGRTGRGQSVGRPINEVV